MHVCSDDRGLGYVQCSMKAGRGGPRRLGYPGFVFEVAHLDPRTLKELLQKLPKMDSEQKPRRTPPMNELLVMHYGNSCKRKSSEMPVSILRPGVLKV